MNNQYAVGKNYNTSMEASQQRAPIKAIGKAIGSKVPKKPSYLTKPKAPRGILGSVKFPKYNSKATAKNSWGKQMI